MKFVSIIKVLISVTLVIVLFHNWPKVVTYRSYIPSNLWTRNPWTNNHVDHYPYFIKFTPKPKFNTDKSVTYSRPDHGIASEILDGATFGHFDYRREYADWSHIYSNYLEDYHEKDCDNTYYESSPRLSHRDFSAAFSYADHQLRVYENANERYLARDPRGLNFSDFVYGASLQSKYNEFVTEYIAKEKCVNKKGIALEIPHISLANNKYCDINVPKNPEILCNPKRKYRRIDGKCNNLSKPNWGSSFHCHRRLLPPDYGDGIQKPRLSSKGTQLPNIRVISERLLPDIRNIDIKLSQMTMQWGQFLVHDVVRTIQYFGLAIRCCELLANRLPLHPECIPIVGFPPDKFTIRRNQSCINTVRSIACNTCTLGPRQQLNVATPVLDLSNLYGGNILNNSYSLRTFRKGQFRGSHDFLNNKILPVRQLPQDQDPLDLTACNEPLTRPELTCFHSGDGIRVNQNPTIHALSVAALRRHNQHAYALSHINPHWNDEILFQEARRILIAETNAIHFGEYLPSILGKRLMRYFKLDLLSDGFTKYDPHVDPSSIQSVGVAAHRFGHSQIASLFNIILSTSPHFRDNYNYSLRDKFFEMSDIWFGNTDGILKGLVEDPAFATDPFLVIDVKDFLFFNPRQPLVTDLPAININRGRDHGVPAYVHFLQYCTGVEINSWVDLDQFMPTLQVKRIRQVYRHWKDIDLFVGGLSETHVSGSNLGPTFACLIGIQFYHWKYGDRFYFEHGGQSGSFTSHQLNNIRRTASLSNFLCKTTSIDKIQINAFYRPSENNYRIPCHSMDNINYELWRDSSYDYK